MTSPQPRIAVLASGRGSNLQAIVDAIAARRLDARLVGVFSDRPEATALARVDEPLRWHARPRDFPDRAAFDQALGDALAAVAPDWIVCAGYMRLLGARLVQRFTGRMLNIHPSLLPLYPGLHTHAAALAAGDAEHGATVHVVTAELDAGPRIAQVRIPIRPDESAEQLAARLLPHEHRLLLAVLRLAVAGRLRERDGKVQLDGHPLLNPLQLDCAGDDALHDSSTGVA